LQLKHVDIGFDADRVLLLQLTPLVDEQRVTAADRRDLYRRLLARAESVPGVGAASLSFTGLFNSGTWGNAITVEGFVAGSGAVPRTFANAIAPHYFEVLGLEMVQGRPFSPRDHEAAPPVAIVNQTFARHFFGDADPIGRHVGLGAAARTMMEIVGVAADAKYVDLREEDRPMLYVPFMQYDQNLRSLEVRTTGAPGAVAGALREQLAAVDRRVAIVGATTLDAQIDASIAAERLIARLSATFGLLALALAAVGLYGLTAYMTAQRTSEIGIRIALGGRRRDVRWLIVRDLLVLVSAGIAIGLPVALGGARLLDSQLYQVGPGDPLAILLGVSMLCVAALGAGYIPARRAARINPLAALRCE
jgi:predicted permease